jgi:hypothetical protein
LFGKTVTTPAQGTIFGTALGGLSTRGGLAKGIGKAGGKAGL